MLVAGAMRLGNVVDSACRQGCTTRRGAKDRDGECPLIIERPNGRFAAVFTDDLDVIIGPAVVSHIEAMLDIEI